MPSPTETTRTETTPRTRELPALTAPVDAARFVEVTGERCALFGREEGPFECWIWPIKVLSGLRFRLLRRGVAFELAERSVTVLPGELLYVWKGSGVQLRTEIFACRERPGLAFGFALDSEEPLELEVSFQCDFRLQWPAGLGAQLAMVDRVTGALALSEELGRFAVLIGASGAKVELEEAEHGLPRTPVRVVIPLEAGGSSSVLSIAGAEITPDPLSDRARRGAGRSSSGFARAERAIDATRELWWRLESDFSAEREAVHAHWRAHQATAVRIETPDAALDEAFHWAEIAIERAWVRVEGLGRGLVGGLGPSGSGERPGNGWFFDGDALAASRALCASGAFDAAREVLRFAASHQRADGKMMHQLALSARHCRWLEDYPYAYGKGHNSADFVVALELYLRVSGDLDLARELWPAVTRALEWCARSLDAEGRLANSRAGIGAVEAGPVGDKIDSEVFLQGAWIAALGAAGRLAAALGQDATRYRPMEELARTGFEAYWSEERGHYGFALLDGGARCDDLSAYLGYPLARGLGERSRAWATVQALNRPELMGDRGARRFARDSKLCKEHRTNDAVLPQLTGYVLQALFAHGHAFAAHQVLFSQVAACNGGGLGFLAEELEDPLGRGAPHQIASSAALVEATLFGLFGVEASEPDRRVAFRPTLPPGWSEARLLGLSVGSTRLDVRLYRRREPGVTTIGLEVQQGEGPSLQIGFAPVLPPLTKLLDGPGWLRPSGGVVPRRLHRSAGEPLTLEARVLEGPALALSSALPAPGEPSCNVRLAAQRLETDGLHWTFAGLAGTKAAVPFSCDFAVEIEGALLEDGQLTLLFPEAPEGEWTTVEVGIRSQ